MKTDIKHYGTILMAAHDYSFGEVLPVKLLYDLGQPYMVGLEIQRYMDDPDPALWELSRDVFVECVVQGEPYAGTGDFVIQHNLPDDPVKLAPWVPEDQRDLVKMHFQTGEGCMHGYMKRDILSTFLHHTLSVVPQGNEIMDVDECIRELLA